LISRIWIAVAMRALADVAVGEATDMVRSVHDGLKELHVLAGKPG